MCGIYGAVSLSGRPLSRPAEASSMAELLQHRGPDSGGEMRSETAVIGVQRLRIVDLNTRADQPFSAIEDQVWLACNGEIYNSTAIRARHQGYPFRSDSDVEPILPLYLDEGPRAIAQLDGMFAVAIWDSRQNTLVLARDRAGEKPLFVAQVGDEIWFSSEIASLLRNPDVDRTFDLDALGDYLRLGYVLQPRTMFRGVRRIEAGTIVTFRQGGSVVDAYWQPATIPIRPISERDAEEAVQAALDAAVERQIRADVPVGVFSSGGLDSSLLVQLSLEKLGLDRVRSFSLRFPRHSYDESPYAEKFAAERSIPHITVTADDESLLAILPTIIDRVAEPIADPAMLATALLSRTARETVTVVLTGEGADELFGGYPTYLGHRMAQRLGHVPAPLRNAITTMVGLIPSSSEKVTIEYLLKRFMDGIGEEPLCRMWRWFGTGLPAEITSRPFADAEVLRRELGEALNQRWPISCSSTTAPTCATTSW